MDMRVCDAPPSHLSSSDAHSPYYPDTQAPHRAHAIDRSASLFPFSPPTNTIASPAATSVNKEGTDKHTRRGLAAAGAAFEEEAPPRAGGGVGQGWFGSHNVPSDRDVYDYLGFGLKVNGRGGCRYVAHPLIS